MQKAPPTPKFVFVVTFFATIGGFLVGYDIGIVSGSMLFVRPYFDLTTFWTETIVSGAVASAAVRAVFKPLPQNHTLLCYCNRCGGKSSN